MTQRFEYGTARVKDLQVRTRANLEGKAVVTEVVLDGREAKPTPRFWNSLHIRFGFTANIFRYFTHAEVFERIGQVAPNDEFRWCLEHGDRDVPRLLAVTGPTSGLIRHDDLCGLLARHGAEEVKYSNGMVRSKHAPRCDGTFHIAGDKFQNKFVIDTPIDGFGRPAVYLSLLRLICSNGAVGYSPAFRSELNVGKGDAGVNFALTRVLDGFNNEEGYAAMRQRFEAATRSWASVHEANRLYRVLGRLHHNREVNGTVPVGGDGAEAIPANSPLLSAFHRMTGDLSQIYGLANLDSLSAKRQRTLPAACKVYDLLNFVSETATHHAAPGGERALQSFLGEMISNEYDLEGTVDHFSDYRDFFVAHEATTETLTEMQRRSKG